MFAAHLSVGLRLSLSPGSSSVRLSGLTSTGSPGHEVVLTPPVAS